MKKYLVLVCCLVPSIAMTESLDEIVVTASPLGKSVDELIRPVNVLTGEELEREVASTLGDTLNNQLGVNSGSFGPGVGVPVIRGLDGNRVEILQNSTRVQDASDTSFDHAISAEPLLAERIEVVRGPAILRYGNGAIGGVVNVIDNRIPREAVDSTSGAVQLRYNTNNDEKVAVGRLDTGNSTWALHLDGVTRESNNISIDGLADPTADDLDETTDGFIANSNSEADSGTIGIAYTGDKYIIGLSVNQLDSRYGIPPGAHGEEEGEGEGEGEEEEEEGEEVDIDLEQTRYEFRAVNLNPASTLWDKVTAEASYTDYGHVELEIEGGETEVGTVFEVDSIDARLEALHTSVRGWQGALGLQYTERDFSAVGEEAFVPPSETTEFGLYWIGEKSLSFADLELGGRVTSNTVKQLGLGDIDHTNFNFSAALNKQLSERSRFSVAFIHAERAPTSEELLSDGEHVATGSFEIGDPNLNEEDSNSIELNYQFRANDNLAINASVYYSAFGDFIFQSQNGSTFSEASETCAVNTVNPADEIPCFFYAQEDADFFGYEIEGIWQLNDQNEFRLWSDAVRAELDQSGNVPRVPALRIGADWDFSTGPWHFGIGIKYTDEQDRAGAFESNTDSNTNVDIAASYRHESLHVFLNLTNAFDEDVRNSTSFLRQFAPEPGQGLTLGLSWEF